jgi:sugar lactone lactonase YvrE
VTSPRDPHAESGLPATYRLLPEWEQLPVELRHDDVVGVSVDSRDRVFLLTRRESRVVVYDRDGRFLDSWGEGFFSARTHGLTVAPDDTLFVVDEGVEVVYRMDAAGMVLQTIGTPGVASDTGYDGVHLDSIRRGGPPFNKPTNVAVADSGEFYVSDGYGNARVHRFAADGTLLQSWGEPGSGPGQFQLVHGIALHQDGSVLVADRENDRIQSFSPDGEYQWEWADVQRPTNMAVDRDGNVFVSELWRRPIEPSLRLGATVDLPGRVSVFSADGALLARWGTPRRTEPGSFVAPHDLCVDSRGDVYVAEVSYTHGIAHGDVLGPAQSLQKFTPERAAA